ncbi:MAG: SDR family NAD(P)-dependent oxidoreductase [Spirochaetota bacterium]
MPKTIRDAGTVVITGTTSGIGRSFAHAYARRGYSLFLTGRRSELLDHVAEELAHLEDPAGLINNAGFGRSVPFLDDDIDAQVGMVTVHVEATMRLTHAVAPRLIERGAGDIIDVSSLASLFPLPRGAIYASTKAWMEPDEVVAASLKALERRERKPSAFRESPIGSSCGLRVSCRVASSEEPSGASASSKPVRIGSSADPALQDSRDYRHASNLTRVMMCSRVSDAISTR